MPELPDLTIYVEALERFIGGRSIESVRLATRSSSAASTRPCLRSAEGR